jgi:hypothetical protein
MFLVLDKADKVTFRANNKIFVGSIKERKFVESNDFKNQSFFGKLIYMVVD